MKSVTVTQIQRLDHVAINRYGISSLVLMENAGRAVAQQVLHSLKSKKNPKIAIFCGLGNNAGDGFVIARHLLEVGVKVDTFLIGKAARLKEDAQANYKILKKLKYPIKTIQKLSTLDTNVIKKADVVVDAIFGVGLNRELKDPFKSIIETLNKYAKRIIAVDIPSGLDGTTGKIYGVCIKAQKTITFSFAKKGFLKADGPKHVGRVVVVDIGIPSKLKWSQTRI